MLIDRNDQLIQFALAKFAIAAADRLRVILKKLPPIVLCLLIGIFVLGLYVGQTPKEVTTVQPIQADHELEVRASRAPTLLESATETVDDASIRSFPPDGIIDPQYPDRPEYQAALRNYYELGLDKKVLPGGGRISPPRPFAKPKDN